MKTEQTLKEIYKEEKRCLEKSNWLGNEEDRLIQKGWVEALECVLFNEVKK
jgi:hypothetical protein|tara:strand:+ start:6133 stop:6285 length:153 start_codon:yes stop_codon:yes gene_type:complete